MSSLNAGNELDDPVLHLGANTDHEDGVLNPEFIFPDAEPGEIPELEQDLVIVTSMDASLESLIDLKNDILAAGGMTRNYAMECERLLPNALSTPVKHFSNVASATGYKVSLEEITHGMWALIAAATAALVGLIWKIVGWWTGKKDGTPTAADAKKSTEAKVEKVEASQEAVAEAKEDMEEVKHQLHNYPIEFTTQSNVKVRYTSLDNVIAHLFDDEAKYSRARKMLENPDPIHTDIVDGGKYSQAIEKLAKSQAFHAAQVQLQNKVRELKELHFDDRQSADGSIVPGMNRRLEVLKKPIEVSYDGKTIGLDALARLLSNERTTANGIVPKKNIHFDDLFARIDNSVKKDYLIKAIKDSAVAFESFKDMSDALTKLQQDVGNISQDGNPGATTEGIAARFREVLPAVKDDLAAYANIMLELERFTTHFNTLATTAVGFSTDIVLKVTREMRDTGAEIPKEWQLLKKRRSEALKKLERAQFPGADMSHLRD